MTAAADSPCRTDLGALRNRLAARLEPDRLRWLDAALGEVGADGSRLPEIFPGVARRVGRAPLLEDLPKAPPTRLHGASGPLLNPWSADDAARAALLLADALREPAGAVGRAVDLYFTGDGRERGAVLRALSCLDDLPQAEAGLAAVRDALRVNAADLYAAAVCENLYTSHRLPDELFRQAVLKAAFVGLRLDRIERIEERATPELSRMLFAYVTEREHAGRPVPADLWPILALHAPDGVRERVERRLAAAATRAERGLLELALERLGR